MTDDELLKSARTLHAEMSDWLQSQDMVDPAMAPWADVIQGRGQPRLSPQEVSDRTARALRNGNDANRHRKEADADYRDRFMGRTLEVHQEFESRALTAPHFSKERYEHGVVFAPLIIREIGRMADELERRMRSA